MGFFDKFKKNKTEDNNSEVEELNVSDDSLEIETSKEEANDSVQASFDETSVFEETLNETISVEETSNKSKDFALEEVTEDEKNANENFLEESVESENEAFENESTENEFIENKFNENEASESESFENETDISDEAQKKEKGFFGRLFAGLTKTRNSINESFNALFSGFSKIDDDFYEELEETLIMADLGLDTTENIIEKLQELVKKNHIKEVEECRELVVNIIKEQMLVDESAYDFENQKTVMLIIGVNGVGKTTSIGKLAAQYKGRGKKVLMCAADTFRAAAIDQLKTWANRAGVEIIAQNEGSDPTAVTFDAVKSAQAKNTDILLVDTAGRLHNKKNLMDELAKMKRIIEREYPDAHLETLIVLDGSTGQNALEQARQFSTVTNIDGIILTKLDGTAKGGIAIAIQAELDVPVKYIGVGEKINDLQKFDPESYVNALFADMDTRSDLEILIDTDEEA